MRRLFIVYNPRSSRYETVAKEVLEPARKLKGWMVGRYEVQPPGFQQNVMAIAKLLNDDDLVIAVGGDGTVSITLNAVIRSGKKVVMGALGYGNFNDVATMLKVKRPVEYGGEYIGGIQEIVEGYETGRIARLYPLEVTVDEEVWRYAGAYFTMGLLARSTEVMEAKAMRKRLKAGHRGTFGALCAAVGWYLKNKRGAKLPEGTLNGRKIQEGTTDYLAVNGASLARAMRAEARWQEPERFGSSLQRLGKFWRMVRFGLVSVFKKVPVEETKGDVIQFNERSKVGMQIEGEYEEREVRRIEIKKTERPVRVVLGNGGV